MSAIGSTNTSQLSYISNPLSSPAFSQAFSSDEFSPLLLSMFSAPVALNSGSFIDSNGIIQNNANNYIPDTSQDPNGNYINAPQVSQADLNMALSGFSGNPDLDSFLDADIFNNPLISLGTLNDSTENAFYNQFPANNFPQTDPFQPSAGDDAFINPNAQL